MPRLLAILLPLLAAACQVPAEDVPNSEPVTVRVLQQRAPANIAVLRFEVEPTAGLVPVEELRGQARQALMDRGFSPLAPEYVDREVAARPAASVRLPEAGVLALRVGRWNDVRAASQGLLQARVTGVLYDEGGRVVAQIGLDQDFQLRPAELSAIAAGNRRQALVERMFAELLAPLPAAPPL